MSCIVFFSNDWNFELKRDWANNLPQREFMKNYILTKTSTLPKLHDSELKKIASASGFTLSGFGDFQWGLQETSTELSVFLEPPPFPPDCATNNNLIKLCWSVTNRTLIWEAYRWKSLKQPLWKPSNWSSYISRFYDFHRYLQLLGLTQP